MNKTHYIKFLIGLFLLLFVFYYIKPTKEILSKIVWKYIFLSSLFLIFSYNFRALGFVFLTKVFKNKKATFKENLEFYKISLKSMIINEVSIKGSGDIYKFALLKKRIGYSNKDSAFLTLSDRILSLFSLIFIVLFILLKDNILGISIAIFLGLMMLLIFSKIMRNKIYYNKKMIIISFLSNSLGWFFEGIALYIIFMKNLVYEVSFPQIYLLLASYIIIGYASLIPSSLGIRELIFVLCSKIYSASQEIYFIASLILRVAHIIAIIVLSFLIKILH